MSRAKELQALKARTASKFYCSKCRTRQRERCRCLLGCTVCSIPAQRPRDIEEGRSARCEAHRR